MAKSELLENLKIDVAPYVRNAIIGYGNRIGKESFYGDRVNGSENTYILDGRQVTVTDENDKNFLILVAFVQKMLKKEIGGSNKTDAKLDELIGEILHAIKYNSCSSERNLRNLPESEILNDTGFQAARQAFSEMEGNFERLKESQVEGMSDVAKNGEYGTIKNRILSLESELSNPAKTSEEKSSMKAEIEVLKKKAVEILNKLKNEANAVLSENPEKVKEVKARIKELLKIARESPAGSKEYIDAIEESKRIKQENSEIFKADKKLKDAIEELKEINKMKGGLEAQGVEMGL